MTPRGVAQLSLALLLLAPSSIAAQCPATSQPRAVSLDPASLRFLFRGGRFNVVSAGNAADCRARAMERQCDRPAPEFFVFSPLGFRDSQKIFVGNCAFGGACVLLKSGNASAIAARLPPQPAKCLQITSKFGPNHVACPAGASLTRGHVDTSSIPHLAEQKKVFIADARSAKACRHMAQVEHCGGQPTSFFLYLKQGFKHPSGHSLGTCVLAPTCFPLQKGLSKVSLGNVDPDWCPRKTTPLLRAAT